MFRQDLPLGNSRVPGRKDSSSFLLISDTFGETEIRPPMHVASPLAFSPAEEKGSGRCSHRSDWINGFPCDSARGQAWARPCWITCPACRDTGVAERHNGGDAQNPFSPKDILPDPVRLEILSLYRWSLRTHGQSIQGIRPPPRPHPHRGLAGGHAARRRQLDRRGDEPPALCPPRGHESRRTQARPFQSSRERRIL
jgi:hypothetical protein